MFSIYCVRPISGCSADDVFNYYEKTKEILTGMGYNVFTPMYGERYLRTELEFKAKDYRSPISTNGAIFKRDRWMVDQSDVIYANFLGAKHVSVGSMFELAWGYDTKKQVIVVMEDDNVHQHTFVLEAATIVFNNVSEALEYLERLVKKEF